MSSRQNALLLCGALIGLAAVALGAFGAHALESHLDERARFRFDLGIRYAFIHGLAILAAALAMPVVPKPGAVWLAGWLHLTGIVLFSGSLILLALSGITTFAMLTPVGGLAYILGWACFAWGTRGSKAE